LFVLISAAAQPYGLSCADNVVKECWEEAGVPKELASAALPVGFVSYVSLSEEGLKPDVLFCYDLQLPHDFVPKPQDGEVGDTGCCRSISHRCACHEGFAP
jgi:8-oxo-dGTP pyrophosphatase MutT (NUDIX family)